MLRRIPRQAAIIMLNRERWQSLEPLLDEVLELAPTARTRWLGELAARSPGRRAPPVIAVEDCRHAPGARGRARRNGQCRGRKAVVTV